MEAVRESPRAQPSPDPHGAAWPPRSPFQALLSSPSGRKKWRDHRTRVVERSPSPTGPRGSAVPASDDEEDEQLQLEEIALRRKQKELQRNRRKGLPLADDEQDEEDVQLRLDEIAIQRRQLQRARSKRKPRGGGADEGNENESESRRGLRADTGATGSRSSLRPSTSAPRLRGAEVEVPASPAKDRTTTTGAPPEPLSPARKRLGLDAAARAPDVSLKRARDGGQSQRRSAGRAASNRDVPRPTSFNERLRAGIQRAEDHEAKQDRIERSRSTGFSRAATAFADATRAIDRSSRAVSRQADAEPQRPPSARDAQPTRRNTEASVARSASPRPSRPHARAPRPRADSIFRPDHERPRTPHDESADGDIDPSVDPDRDEEAPSSSYDPFSEIHLSKRHIAHAAVAREMENKAIYTLPRLLKEVKAPHYDPPDCEEDYVVFAILAAKSSPYDQKSRHKTSGADEPAEDDDAHAPRNKFLVFKLCDLKWEVDLFLFGTGFDQFWKLTPGTLLAILNPGVMPPKTNQHSGHFSLKLSSCEDKVMEIGIVRDLGYCTSVKKDGQPCGAWIDKRSTTVCEFHLNLFIEKQRKGRMEVNTMWRGSATGNSDPRREKGGSRGREAGGGSTRDERGITTHREYGTLYSVPSGAGFGKSAASLLDADDTKKLSNYTAGEASRKRIAVAQKERDLKRVLDQMPTNVGKEYMQAKVSGTSGEAGAAGRSTDPTTTATPWEKPKATDLGLLNNQARHARLSPAKDRRPHFGLGAVSSSSGRDAVGWGGATRRAGLPQLRANQRGSPEKGQTTLDAAAKKLDNVRPPAIRPRSRDGSLSPSKRARFMLAGKGIREPGRESGGAQELKLVGLDDDDDDGLDIV